MGQGAARTARSPCQAASLPACSQRSERSLHTSLSRVPTERAAVDCRGHALPTSEGQGGGLGGRRTLLAGRRPGGHRRALLRLALAGPPCGAEGELPRCRLLLLLGRALVLHTLNQTSFRQFPFGASGPSAFVRQNG